MGWVVNVTLRPLYPWERDPVAILQEVGWVSKIKGSGVGRTMFQEPMLGRINVCLKYYQQLWLINL